jgi:hypothetical protein
LGLRIVKALRLLRCLVVVRLLFGLFDRYEVVSYALVLRIIHHKQLLNPLDRVSIDVRLFQASVIVQRALHAVLVVVFASATSG